MNDVELLGNGEIIYYYDIKTNKKCKTIVGQPKNESTPTKFELYYKAEKNKIHMEIGPKIIIFGENILSDAHDEKFCFVYKEITFNTINDILIKCFDNLKIKKQNITILPTILHKLNKQNKKTKTKYNQYTFSQETNCDNNNHRYNLCFQKGILEFLKIQKTILSGKQNINNIKTQQSEKQRIEETAKRLAVAVEAKTQRAEAQRVANEEKLKQNAEEKLQAEKRKLPSTFKQLIKLQIEKKKEERKKHQNRKTEINRDTQRKSEQTKKQQLIKTKIHPPIELALNKLQNPPYQPKTAWDLPPNVVETQSEQYKKIQKKIL